jgi:hypothetical protein
MDEVIIDGVAYVQLYYPSAPVLGDPSGIWDRFDEKERNEIKRKMIAHLVEAGCFMRKDDYEKRQSMYERDVRGEKPIVYEEDELFYGI